MVVPNDTRKGSVWKYKNRSQIFDTIYRLWQYVQSLVVLDSKNWRVVVGRLGKIGHGEFKAWTQIMSKQSLRAFNNSLKGKDQGHHGPGSTQRGCRTCSFMPGSQEIPVILSACLVNTEAEPNLRIFTSYSSQTDVSKNGKLKVQSGIAEDPSVTHIMVFPTRSDTGHQGAQEEEQDDFAFGDNFGIPDEQDDSLIEDVDFTIFGGIDNPIDYQPLASGFFISTAPATDLPDWFWSPYPAGKHRLPVHLKSSLYLNCQGEQDDSISKNSANHPLEASTTDEVLKYVLETYNALSWLSVDMLTGARHSCLPVHMQALLRLYRSVKNIFSS
jgi:mediator of RNA polymerase II transcription subunit 13